MSSTDDLMQEIDYMIKRFSEGLLDAFEDFKQMGIQLEHDGIEG